ncbi:glutamate receptor 2.8-like [Henckelia pumila]|uniref:glutamate receptor 2.8-like n=1 Tax=Henckelia pumila TaxID=405737 RepID=UPI003C6DCF60
MYTFRLQNLITMVLEVTMIWLIKYSLGSQYVDFTLPYTESGFSMVVPIEDDKSKNAWVFLKPLTWELWLTSFCSFVFIGALIWILEHRINEYFRGPPLHQVGMIFWFAFSTMVFAHKERVISNLSRINDICLWIDSGLEALA